MIQLTGHSLVNAQEVAGSSETFHSVNPATQEALNPPIFQSTSQTVDEAVEVAQKAFVAYCEQPLSQRADFLEKIARSLEAHADQIVQVAMSESGLPEVRMRGELGRTCGQLRLFAQIVKDGQFLGTCVEHAQPERKPLPKPDLRLLNIPLGVVSVFGASNFPLAFSTAGGDTASALAAGCPVIVRSHPLHALTSELVGRCIQNAAKDSGIPAGVFALVQGQDHAISRRCVQHPAVQAVGFTGSLKVGRMLFDLATQRPNPIPFYGEFGSVNPVVLLPDALQKRGTAIGEGFCQALTMGAGQFCTNPGVVLAVKGKDLDTFVNALLQSADQAKDQTMLSQGIHQSYCKGVQYLTEHDAVQNLKTDSSVANSANVAVFKTSASAFLQDSKLSDEVFGPCCLIVECDDLPQLQNCLESFDGQLTATLHCEEADFAIAKELMPLLTPRVGRILFNGFPTGVEVTHAMMHGGPYPASSDVRGTSVGSKAIERFLRPLCFQNTPKALLPEILCD